MMHFGLYSSQSSFCRECSLASFFCLNLSGTFVSELPHCVPEKLQGSQKVDLHLSWKDAKYLLPEVYEKGIVLILCFGDGTKPDEHNLYLI